MFAMLIVQRQDMNQSLHLGNLYIVN